MHLRSDYLHLFINIWKDERPDLAIINMSMFQNHFEYLNFK